MAFHGSFPWMRVREHVLNKHKTQRIVISHGPLGHKLKQPVSVLVSIDLDEFERATVDYIIGSLTEKIPRLLGFGLENRSILEMAKFLLKYRSGSNGTLRRYIYGLNKFCSWLGETPDQIILNCIDVDSYVNVKKLQNYALALDNWVGILQARNAAPMTINTSITAIKAFFKNNGLDIPYSYTLPKRIVNRDRAPAPEELQLVLDMADIRGKMIVSMLALGGFRVGTLSKLCYYHVMHDLERGLAPVHIHIESEITKGKYHDYDTFIGAEAVEYLKIYLDMRRRGAIGPMIPPEEITLETPLIRNHKSVKPKLLDKKRISIIVHNFFLKAGILKGERRKGKFYGLRPHSLRKFFRTQLAALGVPADYIEYMMGHTISTYHDIQMKGVDFLRNIYIASGLAIKPKTRVNRIEMLKEIIRAWGLNPEEILTRKAFSLPHRTVITPINKEEEQAKALSQALKQMLRKELLPTKSLEG